MITEPDQVKQIYTAPADVLHPGEGARVLRPIVGSNSVLLLDEDAHMEQRKLMLPPSTASGWSGSRGWSPR